MEAYPLWCCGFLNNRLISFSILYCATILGVSKMILLVKPMVYHAADHDRVVKIALYVLGLYLVQDTIVYLMAGNIYYCHSGTMIRVAAMYNMSIHQELVRSQKISMVHNLSDVFCVLMMLCLEIIINSINIYKAGKVSNAYRKLCKQGLAFFRVSCKTNIIQDIEMQPTQPTNGQSSRSILDGTRIVIGPNSENYSRESSNRNYLLICIVLYLNIIFCRSQTEPGARYTDWALLCWRLYSRYKSVQH